MTSQLAGHLVKRFTNSFNSDTGEQVINSHSPPDPSSSCYSSHITAYAKDGNGVYYTGCWRLMANAVKDGGVIVHQPTSKTLESDTTAFKEGDLFTRADGAGNLEFVFDAIIALSPKARNGSDTEFFTSQFEVSGAIDGSYEPHVVGRKSANGALGHLWFATDGTRNTEEINANSVAAKNQVCDAVYDSAGDLHVAYIESTTPEVRYTKLSGGTWSGPESVAGTAIGGQNNVGVSIDVDENDVPIIVWNNDGTLYYAERTASPWTAESSGVAIKKQDRSGLDLFVASSTLKGVAAENGSDAITFIKRDGGTWSETQITATTYRTAQLWHNGTDWAMTWIHGTNNDLNFAVGNPTDGFSSEIVDDTRTYRTDYRVAAVSWNGDASEWTLAAFQNENGSEPGRVEMFTGTAGSWTHRNIGATVSPVTGGGSDEANLEFGDHGFISQYVDVGGFGGSELFGMAEDRDQNVTYDVAAEFHQITP